MSQDPTLNRSLGRDPDLIEIKVSGALGGEEVRDLGRGQEVELTVRGVVSGHTFTDKEKDGAVITTKSAVVKVDQLLVLTVLGWRGGHAQRRGQTSIFETDADEQPAEDEGGEVIDAEVVAELEAGPQPPPEGDAGGPEGDPEPPAEPRYHRHPQVPEEAWEQLDHQQKHDVLERVEKIEKLYAYLPGVSNPTDQGVAEKKLEEIVGALHEDYGIELIPADDVQEADEKLPGGPPPAPVTETSPPMTVDALGRRKAYLEARRALPAEAEEMRAAELAEIARRLDAQGSRAS